MKNKIVLVICVVIMLVPALLAVFLYKPKQPEIINTPDDVSLVVITDSLSNTYTVEDKDEIKFLTDLANGESVSTLPDAVYGFKSFVLRFTRGDSTASYRFYMSADMPDQVYFKDGDGKCYKADGLKSRTFMEKPYAVSLYDTAVPVLTAGDASVVVSPSEISWNYRTADGNYTPVSVPTTTEVKSFDKISKKTLGLSFSRKPTNAVITIYDGSEKLVSRLYDEFTGVSSSAKESKYYKIEVKATWNDDADQNSYGEATYVFNALIMPDATFSVSAASIQQGAVIALRGEYAQSSGISFSCEPDIGVTPVFYDDGENTLAYLPTDYDTAPGEYTLSLSYDGSSFEQKITVVKFDYSSKSYDTSESDVKSIFSAENQAAEDTMKQIVFTSSSPAGLLCGNEKIITPTKRENHKTGYGITMSFSHSDLTFRHDGADYDVEKGTDVRAVLSGTVVYVGSTSIHGGTVVIDHGNGARSWYCRVTTDGVTVGQSVNQGDVIAKSDNSGFGDKNRMHFGFSVGSVFVSPLILLQTGLPK